MASFGYNLCRMKPNFVLFISDDHSWHDMGAYGAPVVRTPNLDRLASQGMRFDHAYSASPTCAPSRCSIYTGLYPFRHGAHANHTWIREGIRSMPHYLKALGYRVVLAGKSHIAPREQFPFEFLPNSNVMPPGKDAVLWTELNTVAVDALLEAHDRATPLCLVVGSHSPHVYWEAYDQYDPATVDLPPYLLHTPLTRDVRAKYYADVSHLDAQVGEVMRSLDIHGYTDNTFMCYTTDHGAQWPFAKWNLYDAGVRAPLIARWPGHIEPGSTSKALVSLVDLLPTVLEIAGQGAAAQPALDGRSMLGVLMGSKSAHHDIVFATHTADGQMNRSPVRCACDARFKLIHNLAPEIPFRTHIDGGGVRDGLDYWQSWEALAQTDPVARQRVEDYHHRPPEELYDLSTDPYELNNLAGDLAHSAILQTLRQRLGAWRIAQGEDLSRVATGEDSRVGPVPYAE